MRKLRKLKQGARYHVIARAHRREFILNSRDMKELFLYVIKRAKKKYKFQVINYVVMGNHIHIMLKPGEKENLSKIMQWILSVFAVIFNKLFGYIGQVWYDRFKSFIISDIRQFLKTFDYIVLNPVKANIVKRAEDFEFGGIWHMRIRNYELVEPPEAIVRLMFPCYLEGKLLAAA